MILEAFAEFLHAADPNMPATDVLAQWLWKRLSTPPANNVDKVLHCEMQRSIKNQTADIVRAMGGTGNVSDMLRQGIPRTQDHQHHDDDAREALEDVTMQERDGS